MGEGYHGTGAQRYKNSRFEFTTGATTSLRGITAAPLTTGSRAFWDTVRDRRMSMRRAIVRNLGPNEIKVYFITKYDTGSAAVETDSSNADPITVESGKSIDSYGMLDHLSDILVTHVNGDIIEVFQQPRVEAGL